MQIPKIFYVATKPSAFHPVPLHFCWFVFFFFHLSTAKRRHRLHQDSSSPIPKRNIGLFARMSWLFLLDSGQRCGRHCSGFSSRFYVCQLFHPLPGLISDRSQETDDFCGWFRKCFSNIYTDPCAVNGCSDLQNLLNLWSEETLTTSDSEVRK